MILLVLVCARGIFYTFLCDVPIDKLFVEQPSPEPEVKVMLPMYEPFKVSKCEKCGKVIAEPKELIRAIKK